MIGQPARLREQWLSPRAEKVRFVLVGLWNTAVGYALFVAVHMLAGHALGPALTLVLAYCIALPHAFLTQRFVAFRSQGAWRPQLAKFALANSVIFVANLVFLPVVVALSSADPRLVQAVFVLGSTVASYLAHKHFSFAR